MGWIFAGFRIRETKSNHWVWTERVRDSGPDVRGSISFSWIRPVCGKRRDRGGVRHGRGFLLVVHG